MDEAKKSKVSVQLEIEAGHCIIYREDDAICLELNEIPTLLNALKSIEEILREKDLWKDEKRRKLL